MGIQLFPVGRILPSASVIDWRIVRSRRSFETSGNGEISFGRGGSEPPLSDHFPFRERIRTSLPSTGISSNKRSIFQARGPEGAKRARILVDQLGGTFAAKNEENFCKDSGTGDSLVGANFEGGDSGDGGRVESTEPSTRGGAFTSDVDDGGVLWRKYASKPISRSSSAPTMIFFICHLVNAMRFPNGVRG